MDPLKYMFSVWICVTVLLSALVADKEPKGKKIKAEKIGKKLTDYSDADIERLLDQWDANDEEYDDEDEDDPRLKKPEPGPTINMNDFKGKPEELLKMSKKGKPLMMFVTVAGNPTQKQAEKVVVIAFILKHHEMDSASYKYCTI